MCNALIPVPEQNSTEGRFTEVSEPHLSSAKNGKRAALNNSINDQTDDVLNVTILHDVLILWFNILSAPDELAMHLWFLRSGGEAASGNVEMP